MAEEYATKTDIAELRTEMAAQEIRLLERMEQVETRLLTEFRKWAVPMNSRTKVFEATAGALMERVTMLEERVTGLETDRR